VGVKESGWYPPKDKRPIDFYVVQNFTRGFELLDEVPISDEVFVLLVCTSLTTATVFITRIKRFRGKSHAFKENAQRGVTANKNG
jgi:hypothetical protein